MAKLPETVMNKIFSYLEDIIDYGWTPYIDEKGRLRLRAKRRMPIHNVIHFKSANTATYVPLHIRHNMVFDSQDEFVESALDYSYNLPLETILEEDQEGFVSMNYCYSFVESHTNSEMFAYVKKRRYYNSRYPYRRSCIGWLVSSDKSYRITNIVDDDDDEEGILRITIERENGL